MKKVVIFVKKRKDITMQQFKDHIVNRHSVIEKKLWKVSPWVKKGTRSFIIPDTSFPQGSGEEPLFDAMFELADKLAPLGNATAEECAEYVVTLLSDLTRKVTLQNLFHDGGFSNMGMNEKLMEFCLENFV